MLFEVLGGVRGSEEGGLTFSRRGASVGRMKDLGMKLKFLRPKEVCIRETFRCMESFLVISWDLGKWFT